MSKEVKLRWEGFVEKVGLSHYMIVITLIPC